MPLSSENHIIPTHTKTRIFKKRESTEPKNCVRVYRSSPSNITMQIWAYGPTNEWGDGVPRETAGTAYLTLEQVDALIEALQAEKAKFD